MNCLWSLLWEKGTVGRKWYIVNAIFTCLSLLLWQSCVMYCNRSVYRFLLNIVRSSWHPFVTFNQFYIPAETCVSFVAKHFTLFKLSVNYNIRSGCASGKMLFVRSLLHANVLWQRCTCWIRLLWSGNWNIFMRKRNVATTILNLRSQSLRSC